MIRIADYLPRLTFLQSQVDALRCHFLVLRQIEQLAQGVLGAFGMRTDHAEIVAAPADLDIQARLEQTQILIERATQVREPRVVCRLEIEFPLRFGS
jgi:hypothetical protein